MLEAEFERQLERLFDRAPELPDGAAFGQRIGKKLHRRSSLRRWMIGSAGLAGGVVAASQLMLTNAGRQLAVLQETLDELARGLSRAATGEMSSAFSGSFGVWVALGLAVLAMGFVLSRVIEEF